MTSQHERTPEPVPTGVEGLDWILRGGLPPGRACLLFGENGTGKTTLGLQYLLEGVRRGERCLYITLLQTRDEVEDVARSHGWSLDGLDIVEIPEEVATNSEQSVFSPAEVEVHEITEIIERAMERVRPDRLVLDSVTELAVLVDSMDQLRRQILQLKRRILDSGCAGLLTANIDRTDSLQLLQTITTGVIELAHHAPTVGVVRRTLRVVKIRGRDFASGRHDFRIHTGGVEVFPRIEPHESHAPPAREQVSAGNAGLDRLLGGGLERGSTCIIAGTSGAGKSSVVSQIVSAAAQRGERSAMFCFDEERETTIARSEGLGVPLRSQIERGLVDVREQHAGGVGPGEFMQMVRRAVDQDGARIVVIDSVTGFLAAMPEERLLVTQLLELTSYLSGRGVLTLLVVGFHGVFVSERLDMDLSYLSDTMVLLRHFEARGRVRKCVSVLKKRAGAHESTIREIEFGGEGVRLGPPLEAFSGVLTGLPRFEGERRELIGEPPDARESDDARD